MASSTGDGLIVRHFRQNVSGLLGTDVTIALTAWSVMYSKRLADMLDLLSDRRMGWRGKWHGMRRARRETL